MGKAKQGDKVKVHYTGTLEDGTVFDSSEGREPLEFVIGGGQLLKMFEASVDGLDIGESVNVDIPAKEGYGEHQSNLVGQFPIDQLPAELEPKIGMKLQMQTQEGHAVPVTVTALDAQFITIDANHELAGKDLKFNIRLVEIG